jgi:hypothetical protein
LLPFFAAGALGAALAMARSCSYRRFFPWLSAGLLLISAACTSEGELSRWEDMQASRERPEPPLDGLEIPTDNEVDDPCDVFDNDVDGEVDEGCYCREGETQPCYPGHPSLLGVGTCAGGMQHCQDVSGDFFLGSWSPCEGATTPLQEICDNGIDEDCSGDDLACPAPPTHCDPGETRPCYPGPEGTMGVGLCAAGEQICTAIAQWSACLGAVTPIDEICENELDEDCDGEDAGCEVL